MSTTRHKIRRDSAAADALAIGYSHLAATDPLRAHLFKDRKYV